MLAEGVRQTSIRAPSGRRVVDGQRGETATPLEGGARTHEPGGCPPPVPQRVRRRGETTTSTEGETMIWKDREGWDPGQPVRLVPVPQEVVAELEKGAAEFLDSHPPACPGGVPIVRVGVRVEVLTLTPARGYPRSAIDWGCPKCQRKYAVGEEVKESCCLEVYQKARNYKP